MRISTRRLSALMAVGLCLAAEETTSQPALVNDKEWTRADNGHDISWPDAQRFCQELGRGWRLPSIDELASLYSSKEVMGVRCGSDRCRVPALFDLTGSWFWSADSVGGDGSDGAELAWGVQMVNGVHTKSVKELPDGSRALCVRQPTKARSVQNVDAPPVVTLPIDPSHTSMIFSWSHRGLSHPTARLEQLSGTLLLDRGDLSKSSVKVTFPLEGLRTGSDALDKRLRGPDFFDARQYPVITFSSTRVDPIPGTNQLTVVGDLTVHGVTVPVTLHATLNQLQTESADVAVGFDAEGALRRSDFGLSRYVPLVGDDVTLRITLEAHAGE